MFKMIDELFHKAAPLLFILTILLFSYFRLRPIYFQTVPYTYDQGRDFLKAAQIIREGDVPFIGPTTGIGGVFHGSWWYYFLAIPYLVFGGNPIGFYYAMFILQLISVILFSLFLKKSFNLYISFIFLLIVSASPYFGQNAYFPANNILTPYAVLLFIFAFFRLMSECKPIYAFLTTLAIGFILETELSFGMFVIPAFIITFLLFSKTRNLLRDKRMFPAAIIGFVIPSLPRLLFELKNNFAQTHALFSFFQHPTSTNVVSIQGAFFDRITFFSDYFKEIFYERSIILAGASLLCILVSLILGYKHKKTKGRFYLYFFILLTAVTFILTTLSHNNFFWGNYLEGYQYIFLFIFLTAAYEVMRYGFFRYVILVFVAAYIGIHCFLFYQTLVDKNPTPLVGLRADMETIKSYYQYAGTNICLQIYTPPVIPFTYNYLLQFNSLHGRFFPNQNDLVSNACWYIVDYDQDTDRLVKWRQDHIPKNAKLIEKHRMGNNTFIELWQRHP